MDICDFLIFKYLICGYIFCLIFVWWTIFCLICNSTGVGKNTQNLGFFFSWVLLFKTVALERAVCLSLGIAYKPNKRGAEGLCKSESWSWSSSSSSSATNTSIINYHSMRLLRTLFIHHKHKRHLLHPKCTFSFPFSSLLSDYSTAATTTETDSPEEPNGRTNHPTGSGWSMYADVVAQHRLSDDEAEEKPSGGGMMLNLKRRVKRTGRVKTQWVCCNCGYEAGQWWGTCPSCGIVGTMKEFHEAKLTDSHNKLRNGLAASEDAVGLWLPQRPDQLRPIKLSEVNCGFNQQNWRIPL